MATFRDAQPAAPSAPAPAEAKQQITSVQADPAHAYWDQFAVGHDQAVEDVRRLYEAAYPERPTGGEEQPVSPSPDEQQQNVGAITPEALGQALGPREDGLEWNPQVLQPAAASAQELGASAADAALIIKYCDARLSEDPPDPRATETTLREEWGQKYEREIASAQLAVRRVDPVWPGFLEFLDDSALGDDPGLIAWFAKLGRPLLEAAEQIAKIHQDKPHPYNRREDPRHEAAVVEMQRLYAKVYGTRRVGAS